MQRSARRSPRSTAALAPALLFAAALPLSAPAADDDHYLRQVTFELPGHERVLLRWPTRRMPLRVHLPPPPADLFPDPEAILDSVRDGITDWADVAAPGVPSFRFVDDAGQADIRVRWAGSPLGDSYVAYCAPQIDVLTRRFGVEHILVTGRWQDGRLADLHDVHLVMLHEVGHALGFGGHSDDPDDIMYPRAGAQRVPGLSARDRATLRELYARPVGARAGGGKASRER
jgi:predicted Zn-dependent protease